MGRIAALRNWRACAIALLAAFAISCASPAKPAPAPNLPGLEDHRTQNTAEAATEDEPHKTPWYDKPIPCWMLLWGYCW